ncbi:MAG: cyclase family protein [Solirubrobacterales bacterium]|nr:cyclase family protein [Solirubrobacterales bacterium]
MPAFQRTDIAYVTHEQGASEIEQLLGVPRDLLRDREGWAHETVTLGSHNSTHVDAPWHYNSKIDGKPALRIDQLPLEWFFGPGVVVDFTDKPDGDAITASEMAGGVAEATGELHAGDIVLVRTGRDAFLGRDEYMAVGPGVSAEATHWLYDRGVRVMGIDAWGWDRPLHLQAEDALRERRPGIFWEAHQSGLSYCQIERLAGLAQLPPNGFQVACFPLRVVGASAAPARVVALLQDDGRN